MVKTIELLDSVDNTQLHAAKRRLKEETSIIQPNNSNKLHDFTHQPRCPQLHVQPESHLTKAAWRYIRFLSYTSYGGLRWGGIKNKTSLLVKTTHSQYLVAGFAGLVVHPTSFFLFIFCTFNSFYLRDVFIMGFSVQHKEHNNSLLKHPPY